VGNQDRKANSGGHGVGGARGRFGGYRRDGSQAWLGTLPSTRPAASHPERRHPPDLLDGSRHEWLVYWSRRPSYSNYSKAGRRPAFRANFGLGMAFRPRLASRGASLPSITPDNHPFSDLRNCEGYFSGTPFTSELLNLTQERKHV